MDEKTTEAERATRLRFSKFLDYGETPAPRQAFSRFLDYGDDAPVARGRLPMPRRTRAIEESQRLDLEADLKEAVADLFELLSADYPADELAAAIAEMEQFNSASALELAADWFATTQGENWTQALTDALVEHYSQVFNVVGQAALDELGISGSFSLKNPELLEQLRLFGGTQITGINVVTQAQIVSALAEGVEEGEGVAALGRRIKAQVEGMTTKRAELIAVTETANAAGRAAVETYRRNGVERKTWLTAGDSKVTDGCKENEEQSPVDIDDVFTGGGNNVQHPPRFPGCRCSIAADVDDYTAPAVPWTG